MRLNKNVDPAQVDGMFSVKVTGTYTGPLILSGDPVASLDASTKQYVDNFFVDIDTSDFGTGTLPVTRLPVFSGDLGSSAGSNVFSLFGGIATVGSYLKPTVDEKGRITGGDSLVAGDVPSLNFSKVSSGKPTTLAGYGITDLLSTTGGTLTGNMTVSGLGLNSGHAATKGYIDDLISNSGTTQQIGDVIRYPTSVTPTDFFRCNGAELDKTTYATLYAVVGDIFTYGTTPGSGRPWRVQYDINLTQDGDINGWTTGTVIPLAIRSSQSIVTKNRVFILGGLNTSSIDTSAMYSAPINSDGTLGTWTTGSNIANAISGSQAIVTKNRVYLIGGIVNGIASSSVYTATINSDGTLSGWSSGNSLPGVTSYHQAITTKNRVYVLGGNNGGSTVYTAPINSDGTIGAWTTDTSLPTTINSSQAIVTKNRLYLLGGHVGGVSSSVVYSAPINSDGTLGTWAAGNSLPNYLEYSQAIVTRNRVYLLGGSGTAVVYMAPINSDGTLGTWTTGTSLPTNVGFSQAVVTSSKIYLIGGYNATTGTLNTVYVASFSGGLNDYSPYYDGTALPTDPANFRLPDFTNYETSSKFYYIKYQ